MAEVGGIQYDVAGDGPAIVFIHGYGMWGDWWKACGYVDALAPSYRCITIDAPGQGQSAYSTDPADYSMDRIVERVLAVADAEGADEFVAWGHGTGGTLAQALILTGRVTKAAIGACALCVPKEFYEAWAEPFLAEARAGDWTGLRERLVEPPAGLGPIEKAHDANALAAFLQGNPWATTPEELKVTGVPIAAYQGEKDPAFVLGPMQAEAVGASFSPVPGGIRASFVNLDAVLDAVRPTLAV